MATKKKTIFVCQECGYDSLKWVGRCPNCGQWNTLVEETVSKSTNNKAVDIYGSLNRQKPQILSSVSLKDSPRFNSGSLELDRVLGGGIVPGSLILMVGDPGVGKSSLNLRISAFVSNNYDVLYVSGEESLQQIRLRAERISSLNSKLLVLSETNFDNIKISVEETKPKLLIIDSIQTIFLPDIQSAPGSVSQVRECAIELLRLAKSYNITVLIIGHVTKDGTLAGPRVLEHIVDTVLYFEGSRNSQYRILRAVKNRFGSTNEIGLFEMRDIGLIDVPDISKLFLSDNFKDTGIVVTPTVEGTRPVLVEVQSLVASTVYIPPKRTSDSVDIKRLQLLLAVLEKRVNLSIGSCDVYVKIAGGIKIDEPACDLALCVSLASSFSNRLVKDRCVIFGEVGLSGEVRAVNNADIRINEAIKLGFTTIILPEKNKTKIKVDRNITLIGVNTVKETLNKAFN